jgi:hypothetical protein
MRPTGTAPGDLLLATMHLGYSSNTAMPTLTAPAGFTLVRRIDHNTVATLAVYRKIAGASEPASYTWNMSPDLAGVAWLSAYSGVDQTTPIDAEAGSIDTANKTAYSTPSITTTQARTLVVASFTSFEPATSPLNTWSMPAAMSQRANFNNGDQRSGSTQEGPQTTAGPTGLITSMASTTQEYAITHILALRPCQ